MFKKIFKVLIVIVIGLIIFSFFTGKGDRKNEASMHENSVLYAKLLPILTYADVHGIEMPSFDERSDVSEWLTEENFDSEFESGVYVEESSTFTKGNQYKAVSSETEYFYIGELDKKDRPEGLGAIFEYNTEFTSYDEPLLILKYLGYFDEGFYDGYGIECNCPTLNDYSNLIDNDLLVENIHILNLPTYEGYFKKGLKSGEGNEMFSNAGAINIDTGEIIVKGQDLAFDFWIGEFKKDELDKKNIHAIYEDNKLLDENEYDDYFN